METMNQLEQYKMLREEILLYIKQMFLTESWAAIAVGAVYTWLLVHKDTSPQVPSLVWAIPPFVLILGAVRCVHLVMEMHRIGRYLRNIEQAAFGDDLKTPGWERFKQSENRHWFDKIQEIIAGLMWVAGIIAAVLFSWSQSP